MRRHARSNGSLTGNSTLTVAISSTWEAPKLEVESRWHEGMIYHQALKGEDDREQ